MNSTKDVFQNRGGHRATVYLECDDEQLSIDCRIKAMDSVGITIREYADMDTGEMAHSILFYPWHSVHCVEVAD